MSHFSATGMIKCSILLFTICSLSSANNWSLPYPKLDKYDYSDYYSEQLAGELERLPDYIKDHLDSAWSWYKREFTLSNGLIHERHGEEDNSNLAVSEGQGYGMLLAVVNNDQEKFDDIFKAANRYMWDSGRKSYFIWEYDNGPNGSGAATDADLDIGLALVFADKLKEYGYWEPSSAGVGYKERAMEVIASIRTNMCAQDYMLPGDNWDGSGLDNQNPSYYATAWLKVFNQYQDQYDFTPVIDNCYDVLKANTTQYNKGQAPNWCTRNGGQASGIGENTRDMGYDGIRTPWRIAMDALWFDDPRAVEFCENSKNTLTDYSEGSTALYNQMTLYSFSGAPYDFSTQAPTCGTASIWLSAILGSKDPTYSQPSFSTGMIQRIMPFYSHLGSDADAYWYYWQSMGILSFAATMGLFPNILEDLEENVVPPEPVRLTSPLRVSSSSVSLPTAVTISAQFDTSAHWNLTLSGQTSGKTEKISGNSPEMEETWTGNGWYDAENVEVVLEVSNIDENTSPSNLAATIKIISPMDRPDIEPGSAIVVYDGENGSAVSDWNGKWFVYGDESSTISPSPDETAGLIVAEGNPGSCAKAAFEYVAEAGWAGIGMAATTEGETIDLSNFEGVTFDYKTDGINEVNFALGTTNITDDAFCGTSFNGTNGSWSTQTVLFNSLTPPGWGSGAGIDLTVSEKIQWQVSPGTNGTLYIDNVAFKLKSGELPGDDILALMQSSPIKKGSGKSASFTKPVVSYTGKHILVRGIATFSEKMYIYNVLGQKQTECRIIHANGHLLAVPQKHLPAGIFLIRLQSKENRPIMLRMTVQ